MAIIYKAVLDPDKPTLIGAWLDGRSWAGDGPTEILGSYRFDDPEGEVGIENFLVRRGERLLHVPLTYRGAPLSGAEEHLVGTMDHSVLGERWVYDGTGDETAVACFRRALEGAQEQAVLEIRDGDRELGTREQTVLISRETDGRTSGEGRVDIPYVLDRATEGPTRLVARWDGGRAVVATLG